MLFSSMNDLQHAIFALHIRTFLFFLLLRVYRSETVELIKKSLYLFL